MGNRWGLAPGAAIVALFLFSGCTPAEVVPSGPPPVAETPVETQEPLAWPQQLVDIECSALIPQALADAVFDSPPVLDTRPFSEAGAADIYSAAFHNSGSIDCFWQGEQAENTDELQSAIYVTVLPHAEQTALEISTALAGSPPTAEPSGGCVYGACAWDALINGYWMTVGVAGVDEEIIDTPPAVQAIVNSAVEAVKQLPLAEEPSWPDEAASWSTTCEEFVSPETIAEALDLPDASYTVGYSYRSSNIYSGAVEVARGLKCGIAREGGGRSGELSVLPHASGWAEGYAMALAREGVSEVELAGLGSGNALLTENPMTPANAALDFLHDGTWIRLSMGVTALEDPDSMGAAERLTRLAETLIASP